MPIYFTEAALTQARAHQVLDVLKRQPPSLPHLGPYVYKEVGNKHFFAIGKETSVRGQPVFVWLQVLHRNERKWLEFSGDPARFGARVLEPLLEQERPQLEAWLAGTRAEQEVPELPQQLRPWFQPLRLAPSRSGTDIQLFEAPTWIQALSRKNIWDYWETWYRMLSVLIEKPGGWDKAPGLPGLHLFREENAHILFAPLTVDHRAAYLLIAPVLSATPPSGEELIPYLSLNAGERLDLQLQQLQQEGSISAEALAPYTRRTWPDWILADKSLWKKISADASSNLALSAEEESILEGLTGVRAGQDQLPFFLDGRAGSGKSTLLAYVFASYCSRKLQEDWEGTPLYITLNDKLLERARSTVEGMLKHNVSIRLEQPEGAQDGMLLQRNWFQPFQRLLLSLLPERDTQGRGPLERFPQDNQVSFHRFRRLYLGEALLPGERRWTLTWRQKHMVSPESAWFVIRALIKGFDQKTWMTPLQFSQQVRADRGMVSMELFRSIYDHIWTPWYLKLMTDHGLWDEQDLVREVLNEAPNLSLYTLICCDEAQDLTRIEAQLLFRLSVASRFPAPQGRETLLPYLFAGDPLQTVNPSGFRWNALRALFEQEIQAVIDPERRLEQELLGFRTLKHNYRSTRHIVQFLNLIQAWRCALFNLSHVEPQQSWSPVAGIDPTLFVLEQDISPHQLTDLLSDTLLIIDADEGGEAARVKEDPGLSRLYESSQGEFRNLLTPVTAKGSEWPKVVVYGFGARAPVHLWDQDDASEVNRFEREHYWNKLYVALSRATTSLFILDTQAGIERLWRPLLGLQPRMPTFSDQEKLLQWADCVRGIIQGSAAELELLREEDPQAVADNLKKQGEEGQNPRLLRMAMGYYHSLNLHFEGDTCEALALELERNFQPAAELWLKVNQPNKAADALWLGHAWGALQEVLTRSSVHATSERRLLVPFLAAVSASPSEKPTASVQARALEAFLPRLEEWLERGNKPSALEPQWTALARALKDSHEHAWALLSAEDQRRLASVAERLHEGGLSTGVLAAECWYALQEWNSAVRCWIATGKREHFKFYLAKAEITDAPDRLDWWRKAHEYQRIVDEWRNHKTFDDSWKEPVLTALESIGAWEERINAQLNFKDGTDGAADDLLNHYDALPPAGRLKLAKKIFSALTGRKRWKKAVEVLHKFPALNKSGVAEAEQLSAQLEATLGTSVLQPGVDRNSFLDHPTVKEWWTAFLRRIERNPQDFAPQLSLKEIGKLLEWEENSSARTEALYRRLADASDSPLSVEAQKLLKGIAKPTAQKGTAKAKPVPPAPDVDKKPGRKARGKAQSQPTPQGASPLEPSTQRPDAPATGGALDSAEPPLPSAQGSASKAPRQTSGSPDSNAASTLDFTQVRVEALEQLRLKNFRAYADACLKLEDLTVLIGRNGAGKSTLRDALDLLSEALSDLLSNALSRRGGLEACIRQSGKAPETSMVLSVQLRLRAGDQRFRVVYGIDLLLEESGGHRIYGEHLTSSDARVPSFHRDGEQWQSTLPFSRPKYSRDRLLLPLIASEHPVWEVCCEALQGLRSYVLAPAKIREECAALDQKWLEPEGGNAANVLKRLEAHHRDALDVLQGYLRVVVPGLTAVRTETRKGRRSLQFEQQGERLVRLETTQVSEGTLRCLGILLALNQRPAPTLVFLEELEDSIHPQALAGLMESIDEALERTQVIITSHSPTALMSPLVTESRTRLIRWELGRSEIYPLESPPPQPGDYPFSVGELLQFNGLPEATRQSSVHGSYFTVEEPT